MLIFILAQIIYITNILIMQQNEARADQSQVSQKFSALEVQIAELRSREGQLRSTNKVRSFWMW